MKSESKNALVGLLDTIAVTRGKDGRRTVGIPDLDKFWAAYDVAVETVGRTDEMVIY